MPIPEDLGQHYDVRPEQYWTPSYFQVDDCYLANQIATFTQLSGVAPVGRCALDIGAGIGHAMLALQRAGFDIHGIEPSPSFRSAAIERMGIAEDCGAPLG